MASAIRQGQPDTSASTSPYEIGEVAKPRGKLDQLAFAHWNARGITPARRCSDAVFLRRAYLGLIGTLPTADEARRFLSDTASDKRARLVDALLGRPEYATFWALRWGDVLRIKSEFPINLWPNAVQAYHRWVYAALQSNMPYDRFARSLLTASGSNFRVPEVNFYRAVQSRDPESLARAVALTFMGVRAERWPRSRLLGMAAFFGKVGYKKTLEWKEEIVFFDPSASHPSLKAIVPTFPDGQRAVIPPGKDPRVVFADWLIRPDNPWFGRCIANRLWHWLFGRGIVYPADDMGPDHPPCNPALLDYLAKELVAARYELKHLLGVIARSAVFELSPIPRGSRRDSACFASFPVRRLEAEVLIDAVNAVTGSSESYSSPIPEPFTFVPEEERTIALADGSITSSFLELFGRPSRDTGLLSERNEAPSAAQRLHMINSSHIQRKLQQGTSLRELFRWSRQPRQAIVTLYLTVLSRFPTNEELNTAVSYMQQNGNGVEAGLDIAWALINSAEFQYQH